MLSPFSLHAPERPQDPLDLIDRIRHLSPCLLDLRLYQPIRDDSIKEEISKSQETANINPNRINIRKNGSESLRRKRSSFRSLSFRICQL
jgi:hypothetical protein